MAMLAMHWFWVGFLLGFVGFFGHARNTSLFMFSQLCKKKGEKEFICNYNILLKNLLPQYKVQKH